MNTTEIKELRQKGMDLLEKAIGVKIEEQETVVSFIKNGTINNFEANYQSYNIKIDGNYSNENNKRSINALTSKFKNLKIDTISLNKVI
ncbi:MAG: hypothetical protein ACI9JT_000193 [Polaribacter sp.]|jgi:hypothetical protein